MAGLRECGTVGRSRTPVVLRLYGSQLDMVRDYIKTSGLYDTGACQRVPEKRFWYKVVDGSHTPDTALMLQSLYAKKWPGYKWFVMFITGGTSMEKYRQMVCGRTKYTARIIVLR